MKKRNNCKRRMWDFHCLDIEFINIDFSKFGYPNKKAEIELRIFFDERTGFGDALMDWSRIIDWSKFGSFLKVELTKNHTNESLQKVDLSESKLVGSKIAAISTKKI